MNVISHFELGESRQENNNLELFVTKGYDPQVGNIYLWVIEEDNNKKTN